MSNHDPDAITGLDQLHVPDPTDGFWDQLHHQLVTAAADPDRRTPVTETIHATSRRRPPRFALAAALIVIIGLVGLTLWRTAGTSTPSTPAPRQTTTITDPMSINLDPWVTRPAPPTIGTFAVFDTTRLPDGWRIGATSSGAHLVDDPDPAHYTWGTNVVTNDDRTVFLAARVGGQPATQTTGTPVTVHGLPGVADGDSLEWADTNGVTFSVISPDATPDQLVSFADAIPTTTITELHAPDVVAADTPPAGDVRLAGTIDGQHWQVATTDASTVSLILVVGNIAWSSNGAPTPTGTSYDRVTTGLGDHGSLLYGRVPNAITNIRVHIGDTTITVPTAPGPDNTAIYAIPNPAGLHIDRIDLLDHTGKPVHRIGPPVALVPATGTSAHDAEPLDNPNPTSQSTTVAVSGTTLQPAATNTTGPASLAPPPLLAIGESVMLGAASTLQAGGFVVDAKENRQAVDLIADLTERRNAGLIGAVVVIQVGSNGIVGDAEFDQIVQVIPPTTTIWFLTVKANQPWIAANNQAIFSLPGRYPNVKVIDWNGRASEIADQLSTSDGGAHLKTKRAMQFYANMIFDNMGRTDLDQPLP